MERENFNYFYGSEIERLEIGKDGKKLPIYQQVYKLNGLIYNELDVCRANGINPKWSRCHHMLIYEGEKRFGEYGYVYAGIIFVRKDKINPKKGSRL